MICGVLMEWEDIKLACKAPQTMKIQMGKMLSICKINMNNTLDPNEYFGQILFMCLCMMASLPDGYNAHVFLSLQRLKIEAILQYFNMSSQMW